MDSDTIIYALTCFVIVILLVQSYSADSRTKAKERFGDPEIRKSMEKKKKKLPAAPSSDRSKPSCNWQAFKSVVTGGLEFKGDSEETLAKKAKAKTLLRKESQAKTTDSNSKTNERNQKKKATWMKFSVQKTQLTKEIAMDCEMVGIGDGTESMIARVSLVNSYGYCVYDKFVKPMEKVQDYRTAVSGIRPQYLQNGEEFSVVQREVAEILKGRILVGHALKNDLDVLYLSHPKRHLRDTSRYMPFRQIFNGRTPSLKNLASTLLGKEIQTGEHNSVEDAEAAMQLYMLHRNEWESQIHGRNKGKIGSS